MKARRTSHAKGTVLTMVTTIGVMVAILGMAVLQVGFHTRVLAIRDVQGIKARCAADAAIADAMFNMQKKLLEEPVWDNRHLPRARNQLLEPWAPETSPRYSYSIFGNKWTGFLITATGTSTRGIETTKTIRTTLKVGSYWQGISIPGTIDAKRQIEFDVIGSLAGARLTIRSNTIERDGIMFRDNVIVNGDVLCGPGGDPNRVICPLESIVITGVIGASDRLLEFPPIAAPTQLDPGPAVTGSTTLPQGCYRYDDLVVDAGGCLTIAPDTHYPRRPTVIYVTGDMTLHNSAQIRIQEGAKLKLYIGGQLVCMNSTRITDESHEPKAEHLKIFGLPTCTQVYLQNSDDTYAAHIRPQCERGLPEVGGHLRQPCRRPPRNMG